MDMIERLQNWLEHLRVVLDKMRADKLQHIPDGYLKGYRRLAPTAEDVIGEHCWNCRHVVGYVTWWCDLGAGYRSKDCKWERCYAADELTKADLRAGQKNVGGWIGLHPGPSEHSGSSNV